MLFIKHQSPEKASAQIVPDPAFTLTPHQLSQQLVQELESVERLFNMTSDPDLIDAYIFERAALMARLRYLLHTQRNLSGQGSSVDAAVEPADPML